MQAGRGFIENINGPSSGTFAQLCGQLHTLCFSSGKSRSRLADLDIAQPDILKGLELARNPRKTGEKLQAFLDCHFQDIIDALAFIFDLQCFTVIALSLTHITGDIDIRQKMHLNLDDAVALACLTAASLDIKGKASGRKAAQFCILRRSIELPNVGKDTRIRGRVGTRRPPNWGLVDFDHLVQRLDPFNLFKRPGAAFGSIQIGGQIFI